MLASELLTLYPPIQPYAQHDLAVEPPHHIYIEECGNPKGLPVLYVHGGPGSGSSEDSRRWFDPEIYRIILFDQRGAGRSTPLAELQHNNTQSLVQDMEAIRNLLNIEQWLLFGGSWGSTLSLVYAQTHPEKVLGLILRGIFLGRQRDMEWLYGNDGAQQIFPDYWEEFIAPIPEKYHHFPMPMYYDLLTNPDEKIRLAAARSWANWEAKTSSLNPREKIINALNEPATALSFSRIESHYFMNNCFLEPNQILRNINKLQHLPGIIVHGRYDIVCTLENAWNLHKAWPQSELQIIPNAGHSSSEPGITDALIKATNKMASYIFPVSD